jgi:hypothetical protein
MQGFSSMAESENEVKHAARIDPTNDVVGVEMQQQGQGGVEDGRICWGGVLVGLVWFNCLGLE